MTRSPTQESTAHSASWPKPLIERDAYPLDEVAQRLGVSVRSIYNYMDGGHLRSVSIGRRRLVLKEDFSAFLASLRGEAA